MTVRFETRTTQRSFIKTFAAADPDLRPADPLDSLDWPDWLAYESEQCEGADAASNRYS